MDFYSNIKDYINGKLSASEKKMFETAMSQDPLLEEMVKEHDVYDKLADELLLKDISDKIKNQQQEIVPIQKSTKKWPFILAVLVLSLCAAFFYVGKMQKQKEYLELYNKFYYTPQAMHIRGEDEPEGSINSQQSCTYGHAYLDIGKVKKAKIELESAIENKADCIGEAKFLLALIEIKEGDISSCINRLKEIENSTDPISEKARMLLSELSDLD